MTPSDQDKRFMRQALAEAEKASGKGEIPVGAVLVCRDQAVFSGHNLKECLNDPTAHAEILVLREAAEKLGRWRLGGTLYATLEPCAMCAGALVQARIDRLVFGALDPLGGGCGSVMDVVREPRANHQVEVLGGVLSEESQRALKDFFKRLRGRKICR
jgi:tRNA(adenine34) deaminase